MDAWTDLLDAVEPGRRRLLDHPLYEDLADLGALRIFMEHHVWAVWDFMSLLTALQRVLTCVTVPWVPTPYAPALRRFVNEIKLGEESDSHPNGGWTSHFQLYLDAMTQLGADTTAVRRTVGELGRVPALRPSRTATRNGAPEGAVAFVATTFSFVDDSPVAAAAAFALGREQLIPDLFRPLIEQHGGSLLDAYLVRHVELDEGEHGPLARQLVRQLAEQTPGGWAQAGYAAMRAIEARLALWDAAHVAITAHLTSAI